MILNVYKKINHDLRNYFGNPNFGVPSRNTRELANRLPNFDDSDFDTSLNLALHITPEKESDDEPIAIKG